MRSLRVHGEIFEHFLRGFMGREAGRLRDASELREGSGVCSVRFSISSRLLRFHLWLVNQPEKDAALGRVD